MILYNWKQVLHYSNKSSKEIISIISYITYKPIPYSIYSDFFKYVDIDWRGDNFLKNPKALLENRYKYDYLDIANYIGLSSLRSYPEYQTTGKLSLPLLACLGKERLINNNSLLKIEDNEVLFLFEEAPQGETEWR